MKSALRERLAPTELHHAKGHDPGRVVSPSPACGSALRSNLRARLVAPDLRQEPGAGKPHAGICAAGRKKSLALPRQAIVGDEFRERFCRRPENEMMQFDDRKRRRDRTIGRDPHRHFALDCQASEVVEIRGVAVSPDLTLEEASSDWSLHPELLYGARPRATNLIADQTIAGCYPKLRDSVLDLIGFSERQDKTRIREAHPGLTRAVVAPLAISQLPQAGSLRRASLSC